MNVLRALVGSVDNHGVYSKRRKKNKAASLCACVKLSGSRICLWKMFVSILFTTAKTIPGTLRIYGNSKISYSKTLRMLYSYVNNIFK